MLLSHFRKFNEFSDKWCKREHTEPSALSAWKKKIFDIINKRVGFYNKNPFLMPPRSKFSFNMIKQELKFFGDGGSRCKTRAK